MFMLVSEVILSVSYWFSYHTWLIATTYITEPSTCGRNNVAIWIYLLHISGRTNTVDRSCDAHDLLT